MKYRLKVLDCFEKMQIVETYNESCELTRSIFNEKGQFHCETEPAVTFYYRDGSPMSKHYYINGQLCDVNGNAACKDFYPDGNIMAFAQYERGVPHGCHIDFEDNRIVRQYTYDRGVLASGLHYDSNGEAYSTWLRKSPNYFVMNLKKFGIVGSFNSEENLHDQYDIFREKKIPALSWKTGEASFFNGLLLKWREGNVTMTNANDVHRYYLGTDMNPDEDHSKLYRCLCV